MFGYSVGGRRAAEGHGFPSVAEDKKGNRKKTQTGSMRSLRLVSSKLRFAHSNDF